MFSKCGKQKRGGGGEDFYERKTKQNCVLKTDLCLLFLNVTKGEMKSFKRA